MYGLCIIATHLFNLPLVQYLAFCSFTCVWVTRQRVIPSGDQSKGSLCPNLDTMSGTGNALHHIKDNVGKRLAVLNSFPFTMIYLLSGLSHEVCFPYIVSTRERDRSGRPLSLKQLLLNA